MGIKTILKGCAACQKRREKLKRIRELANERFRAIVEKARRTNSGD